MNPNPAESAPSSATTVSTAGGTATDMKTQPNALGQNFRNRRFQLFAGLCAKLPRPFTLLDVGGTVEFWQDVVAQLGCELTVINIFEQRPAAGITVLLGDACDLSRFGDKSFDVVFSNSVIGHVGGWEQQQKMAREVRRVGRRYFLQTPNQGFPVDWRTLMPFFHWLSPAAQAWWFQKIPVGRYRRAKTREEAIHLATRVRNLNRSEMLTMFPDATLVPERVGGFTKSFIVHHGF